MSPDTTGPEILNWLASPQGRRTVRELGTYASGDALAAVERLRASGLSPQQASAAVTQARLRSSARDRLGDLVDGLVLTQDGAQQATRTLVADRHAARFAGAGVGTVADLGCGIGADSLALLRAGVSVLAVERDPVTATAARANLEHALAERAGSPVTARVVEGDALGLDLGGVDAVFADPARRAGGRRLKDPEAWSPPLSAVLRLRGGDARLPLGVKVAPGIDHAAIPTDVTAEWISVDGTLVEAGLWSRDLAPEGPGRHATVLRTRRDGGAEVHHLGEDLTAHPSAADPAVPVRYAQVAPLAEYLLEPDDAVLRAGLVARLVDAIDGAGLVGERLAYVTADAVPAAVAPYVHGYRVLDVLPQHVKKLRAALLARDVGPLTVKKRATSVDPDVLRRRLALRGSVPATLVLAPVAGHPAAILVEPVS